MSYTPALVTNYSYASIADVNNTTGDQTFLTVTIPGGTWQDGEIVTIRVVTLFKNDTGGGQTTVLKFNCTGGTAATLLSTSVNSSSNERVRVASIELMRIGSDVRGWIENDYGDNNAGGLSVIHFYTDGSAATHMSATVTPSSFASDMTVSLLANLATASTSYYVKPQTASIMKSTMRVK